MWLLSAPAIIHRTSIRQPSHAELAELSPLVSQDLPETANERLESSAATDWDTEWPSDTFAKLPIANPPNDFCQTKLL